ncbi:MAG: DUF3054 domain-containing protein [Oscillochloris sp.]|nr:DUF3054 domain-containing protein [Oscillochloris sp.]
MATIEHNQPTFSRVATLLSGDVTAFLVFAAIGRRSHGEAAGLAALGEVALTAAPFLAAWLLASPWLGAYNPRRTGAPAMLRIVVLGWLLALPIGAVLRAAIVGRFSPPSFYIVTFLAVLVILGAWRTTYGWLEARRR